MVARISLDRSLVIRFGNVTYQLNRLLDDRRRIQFENQITGEYKTFELARFFAMLDAHQVTVVGGEDADCIQSGSDRKRQILDLSALPEKEKERLDFRIKIVRLLRKKGIRRGQRSEVTKAIKRFFEKGEWQKVWHKETPPSSSAVMNWMRDYEVSGGNAAALVSGNLHRRRTRTISEAVEEAMEWALKSFYLTRDRLSLTYAYDRLRKRLKEQSERKEIEEDEAKVSMATFQRRKDELDPYAVTVARYGSAYANHKFRYTVTGTCLPRAMARLEVDHTLLNWVVICDRSGIPLGRPTLTIVVDSYSGYIVGMYVGFYGAGITSVINALKNSIRPKHELATAAQTSAQWIAWGIGDCYLVDNGMEFHSSSLKQVAWDLSCDIEYCRVRSPWLKPSVERVFAELDYLPLTPGRVRKPEPNVLRVDPRKDALITLSDLCVGLVKFAVDVHAQRVNRRTLEQPLARFAESQERNPPPQIPETMRSLDLIAAMSKNLSVSSGGVEMLGLAYAGYEHKELMRSAGGQFRTLVKWNPENLGHIHVQHARTKEWVPLSCTRPDYAEGLSWHQHRLIRNHAREKLELDGSVDNFLAAKLSLYEVCAEPLLRRNRNLDKARADRFRQLSATTSTFHSATNAIPLPPKVLMAPEDTRVEPVESPNFETVVL